MHGYAHIVCTVCRRNQLLIKSFIINACDRYFGIDMYSLMCARVASGWFNQFVAVNGLVIILSTYIESKSYTRYHYIVQIGCHSYWKGKSLLFSPTTYIRLYNVGTSSYTLSYSILFFQIHLSRHGLNGHTDQENHELRTKAC